MLAVITNADVDELEFKSDLKSVIYRLVSKDCYTTAGGTRSVIEVLFISFQKFLLYFFPCLAAQHL